MFLGRRDKAHRERTALKREAFVAEVGGILDDIQRTLFERAAAFRRDHTVEIDDKGDFYDFFTPRNLEKPEIHGGFVHLGLVRLGGLRDAHQGGFDGHHPLPALRAGGPAAGLHRAAAGRGSTARCTRRRTTKQVAALSNRPAFARGGPGAMGQRVSIRGRLRFSLPDRFQSNPRPLTP